MRFKELLGGPPLLLKPRHNTKIHYKYFIYNLIFMAAHLGTSMRIIEDYPPNYGDVVAVLGDISAHYPIFCYGDVIYNPYKVEITPDLEAHEAVHQRQQNGLPEAWWYRYLSDPDFRLEQEIEAYCVQYKFALDNGVTGKLKDWIKEKIALSLSSDLYGRLITYGQAEAKLRHYVKET